MSPYMQLLLFLTTTILLLLPLATPISFKFNSFNSSVSRASSCSVGSRGICLVGDAFVDADSVIQLTVNHKDGNESTSAGRAFYSEPLHLWDNSTGELVMTNFTTEFTFNISSLVNDTYFGDGIAFFLSPSPYIVPPESYGGTLGLVTYSNKFSASENSSFVAVEFDTYKNEWDPDYHHIGIDVNSINSSAYQYLPGAGISAKANVSYNAKTQHLTVFLDFNETVYTLSHVVDLSSALPPLVSVGFSATTGTVTELNKIVSWSFESSLDDIILSRDNNTGESNTNKTDTGNNSKESRGGLKKGIIIAIAVVITLIFAVLVVICVAFLCRKCGGGSVLKLAPDNQQGPDDFTKIRVPREINNNT